MTQLRPPLTFADATTRVAGVITYAAMAKMSGRTERAVRYWSEPKGGAPMVTHALAFDAAYREAGGEGSPFLDAFAHQLGVRLEAQDACRRALAADTATAAREAGEAIAASITVASSNASPRETMRAVAEAQQAHTAWGALVRRLSSFLPSGAGPVAGQAGGPLT